MQSFGSFDFTALDAQSVSRHGATTAWGQNAPSRPCSAIITNTIDLMSITFQDSLQNHTCPLSKVSYKTQQNTWHPLPTGQPTACLLPFSQTHHRVLYLFFISRSLAEVARASCCILYLFPGAYLHPPTLLSFPNTPPPHFFCTFHFIRRFGRTFGLIYPRLQPAPSSTPSTTALSRRSRTRSTTKLTTTSTLRASSLAMTTAAASAPERTLSADRCWYCCAVVRGSLRKHGTAKYTVAS